jgi:hypothetical protein
VQLHHFRNWADEIKDAAWPAVQARTGWKRLPERGRLLGEALPLQGFPGHMIICGDAVSTSPDHAYDSPLIEGRTMNEDGKILIGKSTKP